MMAGLGLSVASPMLLADTLKNSTSEFLDRDLTLVFHASVNQNETPDQAERKLKLVSLAGVFKRSGDIVKIVSETTTAPGSLKAGFKYTYVFKSIAAKNKYLQMRKEIVS